MNDDKKDNILDFVKAKKLEKEKLGRGARRALDVYKNYPGPTATPIAFEMAIVVHGKKK